MRFVTGSPPGGGGGGVTDHGGLAGLADDDHTQYGHLSQAETWAALQTFNAGIQLAAAQQIQDSAGTGRLLPATTTPHVTITGETRINSHVGIDSAPSTAPDVKLAISPTVTGSTDWRGIAIIPSVTFTGNNRVAYGLFGSATIGLPAGSSGHRTYGVDFVATAMPTGAAGNAAGVTACSARPGAIVIGSGKSTTITALTGFHTDNNLFTVIFGTATVTTLTAYNYPGLTLNDASVAITTAYGLRIGDLAGTSIATAILAELGPATPYLRLTGGAAPGANLTNLYLNENGTLRRVQWKDGAAIAGGDRVMVLV